MNDQTLFSIFFSAMVVNNFTLAMFLGLCPFMGVSARVETALRMGLANIFVLVLTSLSAWVLNTYILQAAPYLRIISFIIVVASLVQIVEMVMDRYAPALYAALGVFLPLIAVNCAILGASLWMVERNYTLAESTVFGIGSGIGWALAIVALAAIRERLRYHDIPPPLRGLGITFIITGLMAIGFMAFGGIQL